MTTYVTEQKPPFDPDHSPVVGILRFLSFILAAVLELAGFLYAWIVAHSILLFALWLLVGWLPCALIVMVFSFIGYTYALLRGYKA